MHLSHTSVVKLFQEVCKFQKHFKKSDSKQLLFETHWYKQKTLWLHVVLDQKEIEFYISMLHIATKRAKNKFHITQRNNNEIFQLLSEQVNVLIAILLIKQL